MLIQSFQAPSAKTIASALASAAAAAVILRSILRDHVPPELRRFVRSKLRASSLSSTLTLVFEELVAAEDGRPGLAPNHLFAAAKAYLSPQTSRLKAALPSNEARIAVTVDANQEVVDFFRGVKLTWTLVAGDRFELSFHRRHRDAVFASYLPHVLERSALVSGERKTPRLHALKQGRVRVIKPRMTARDYWEDVRFDHPATFETLAMESGQKRAVVEDLRRFAEAREVYRLAGRAWRRGYLIFGPPGTGKSSLVAAMANYLNFDVYDLELGGVRTNSELRKLVNSTGNRSVIVVEDIDCSGEIPTGRRTGRSRRSKVTLSGLLNFIDGLWSSCGDERIVVLTTNQNDRLDPALLRPGRIDVHIQLSYCTPCGFRMLASNYLGLADHDLFPEVQRLVAAVNVTPAEVSKELLKIEEPEASLKGLIKFLEMKTGK